MKDDGVDRLDILSDWPPGLNNPKLPIHAFSRSSSIGILAIEQQDEYHTKRGMNIEWHMSIIVRKTFNINTMMEGGGGL